MPHGLVRRIGPTVHLDVRRWEAGVRDRTDLGRFGCSACAILIAVRPSTPWTAAAAIPPLALILLVLTWCVDVPYWDQWDFAPAVVSVFDGDLSMDMLWRQHADHRLSITMAVHLALARATHWNTLSEVMLNLVVAIATFLALWSLLRRSTRSSPVFLAVLSLLVFNLNQWENWIWGWQLHPLLSALAVVAGFALLDAGGRRSRTTVTAMGLGIVATLSFASGALYWFAAMPLVLAVRRGRGWRLLVWSSTAAVVLALFFGSHRSSAAGLEATLASPKDFLYYVCAYIGAPVLAWGGRWCIVAGAAGMGGFGVLVGLTLKDSSTGSVRRAESLPPCVALATFAVASAGLTGLGRLHLGVGQALSSRYMVVSSLFWAALVALAWSILPPGKRTRRRTVLHALTTCLAALLVVSAVDGGMRMHRETARRADAAHLLLAGASASELAVLYPFPERLHERIEDLRRHRLSVFRKLPLEGQMAEP